MIDDILKSVLAADDSTVPPAQIFNPMPHLVDARGALQPELGEFLKNIELSIEHSYREADPIHYMASVLYDMSDQFLDPQEFENQLNAAWGKDLLEAFKVPASGRNFSIILNYSRLQNFMFSNIVCGFMLQFYTLSNDESTYSDSSKVRMHEKSTEILFTYRSGRFQIISCFNKFDDFSEV